MEFPTWRRAPDDGLIASARQHTRRSVGVCDSERVWCLLLAVGWFRDPSVSRYTASTSACNNVLSLSLFFFFFRASHDRPSSSSSSSFARTEISPHFANQYSPILFRSILSANLSSLINTRESSVTRWQRWGRRGRRGLGWKGEEGVVATPH